MFYNFLTKCIFCIIVLFVNINEYNNLLEDISDGKGYGFLAERVPTSAEAPYRIAVLKNKIQANGAVALLLGGTGSGIESCNGFLKKFNDFLYSNKDLSKVHSCVAIPNFGKKYHDQVFRIASVLSKRYPTLWFLMNNITNHPVAKCENDTMFFHDIFKNVIYPKIVSTTGERLAKDILLKNMRGITIVAYCAGGHTAMQLEKITQQQMLLLGYTSDEIAVALSQIVVIGYAMTCPYEKSQMRFFSFAMSNDGDSLDFSSSFRQYLRLFSGDKFGLLHYNTKQSDTFLCSNIRDSDEITLIPIEEYLAKTSIEANPEHIETSQDSYNNHTFIGYVPKTGFSQHAINLQKLFKQIISESLKNSILNSQGNKFIPLPQLDTLIKDDNLLFQMNKSFLLTHNMYTLNYLPSKLFQYMGMSASLFTLRNFYKAYCKQR